MLSANRELSFIEEVIEAAKKDFISGHESNKRFKEQAKANPALQAEYDVEKRFVSIKNASFSGDATRIPNTSFIAAAGPASKDDVKQLIDDTAFHAHPTTQIVAFASCLSYSPFNFQDFHDYCLKERSMACDSYQIEVKRVSGRTEDTLSGHQIFPKGMVYSQLAIHKNNQEQKLDVCLIELEDNTALNLSKPYYFGLPTIVTKERLWKLYQKSLNESILVHCASGVGRTGHFILIMEILKHYDSIFATQDKETAAQKIHDILNNMRSVRLALVTTEDQFVRAIYTAHSIHEYALKKGYIKAVQPVTEKAVISPVSLFTKAQPVTEQAATITPQDLKPRCHGLI